MNTTYTKKQFLEDVKKEAVALKEHATAEELGKLDFETLSANDPKACIYGSMTGECDSERACELIQKCAPIFFRDHDGDFDTVEKFNEFYYSPIERYIFQDDAQNKNLIDFLKGNRKDLVL